MNIILLTYAKPTFNVASINRLVEEATKRGHQVQRVRYTDCSMSVDGGLLRIYHNGEELKRVDAVLPWIIQGSFKYGLDVVRQFEYSGVFTLHSAEALEYSCNKWLTAQKLRSQNIPTPDTYRAYEYSDMGTHIDAMDSEQSVAKIVSGTRGNGVVLSPDKPTAKSISGTLGMLRSDYIVQEFIEESYGTDMRVYVVNGKVVASMQRQSDNDFRSNIHLGGHGSPVTLSEEEAQLAVNTAKALGLKSGGIDIIRSNRGPLVIEANASAEFGIEKVTNTNVAATIIEYIERAVKA